LCDGALSNRFVHCVNTDPSLLCTVIKVCLNSCLFKGTILQELFSTMPVHEEICSQYGPWKARFQPHSFSTFNSVFINLTLLLHKECKGHLYVGLHSVMCNPPVKYHKLLTTRPVSFQLGSFYTHRYLKAISRFFIMYLKHADINLKRKRKRKKKTTYVR